MLVVEDEDDSREVMERILRGAGAAVLAAGSATQALEVLATRVPDVLVSDIGMPELDGYAFLRQVRGLPASRGGRTPALALTAYARKDDAERAFAAGFQMHVPKPVEPNQLLMMVANLGGRALA